MVDRGKIHPWITRGGSSCYFSYRGSLGNKENMGFERKTRETTLKALLEDMVVDPHPTEEGIFRVVNQDTSKDREKSIHTVDLGDGYPECSCKYFEYHEQICKHIKYTLLQIAKNEVKGSKHIEGVADAEVSEMSNHLEYDLGKIKNELAEKCLKDIEIDNKSHPSRRDVKMLADIRRDIPKMVQEYSRCCEAVREIPGRLSGDVSLDRDTSDSIVH